MKNFTQQWNYSNGVATTIILTPTEEKTLSWSFPFWHCMGRPKKLVAGISLLLGKRPYWEGKYSSAWLSGSEDRCLTMVISSWPFSVEVTSNDAGVQDLVRSWRKL